MNILLLDSKMPSTPHTGKRVILQNLSRELGKYHTLHYACLAQPGESFQVPEELAPFFASVHAIQLTFDESVWGRLRNAIECRPYFFAPSRHPLDFRTVQTRLKEICEDKGIKVIDVINTEAVQYAAGLPVPVLNDQADAGARRFAGPEYRWSAAGARRAELLESLADGKRAGKRAERIKNIAKTGIEKSGFIRLLRGRNKNAFRILMYHRLFRQYDPFLPGVSEETFASQMKYVNRHYNVRPLSEIIRNVKSGARLDPNSLAITFDDGYESTWSIACPILKQYRQSATTYLAVNAVGYSRLLWPDMIFWFLKLTGRRQFQFRENGTLQNLEFSSVGERIRAADHLFHALMKRTTDQIHESISSLKHELQIDDSALPENWMMTWNQIREMHHDGFEFGAHTMNHPVLSRISADEARSEIVESKRSIEAALNVPVVHFAYPNGEEGDFTAVHETMVEKAGFQSACTTILGPNGKDCNLFALRRMYAMEEPLAHFACRLAGLGS